MEQIDHRAEAVRLATEAEKHLAHVYVQPDAAQVYATLAQVHVALAATTDPLPTRDELAARYARHWDYDGVNDACLTAAEEALALIRYGSGDEDDDTRGGA